MRREGDEIVVTASGQELRGDQLLVCVGRRPQLGELGLERAGVEYTPLGIRVNQQLRTTQKHIYAAGDCIGGYQFTHYAGWQGFMAVRNAFFPGTHIYARCQYTTVIDTVPRGVYHLKLINMANEKGEKFVNRDSLAVLDTIQLNITKPETGDYAFE